MVGTRVIQEAIGDHPRRHVFVPRGTRGPRSISNPVRCARGSREDLLRRYQRAAYQHAAAGKPELLKFPKFLQQVRRKRNLTRGGGCHWAILELEAKP
jgi:hypothetical protein